MIRFVGNNPDGLPQKRSQTLRACDHCRKRKKRCVHSPAAENEVSVSNVSQSYDTPISATTQQSLPGPDFQIGSSSSLNGSIRSNPAFMTCSNGTDTTDNSSQSGDTTAERFVGSLNPEGTFLAAASPQPDASTADDNVGIWIPRNSLNSLSKHSNGKLKSQSVMPDVILSNILLPYLQRQCQRILPSAANYAALYRIYVQEIHPILPVIDLESLETRPAKDSSCSLLIKQAICLAASGSPRASRYLELPIHDIQAVENASGTFSSQLTSAMRTSINMGLVEDHIVIIQVLTILALFTQFSHQPNLAAEFAARAISHAQTIGLHLEVPNTRKNSVYLTRLFCCVWAMDKLNAALQGRPTMLHERDFGRDLEQSMSGQQGCFRLLLRVTSLLDGVITLYRPAGNHPLAVMNDHATFEGLINECDALRVPSGLIATVELLFHAVIVLSCRPKSSTSTGPTLEMHETLSAANIVSIIGTEFCDQISYLPFVPYALSLALRVFYRDLRFSSKSPFTRNRSRKQLLNTSRLLQALFKNSFPAAVKAGELAEQIVKEMDKVYNDVLQQSSVPTASSVTVDHSEHNTSSSSVGPSVRDVGYDPDLMSFDDSIFEGLPDLDVFELFNSEFRLEAIDAALMNNIAMTIPPEVDPNPVQSVDQ